METEQQLQEEQGEKKAGWGKKRVIALAAAIGAVVVAAVLLLALLPGGNGAAIGEPRPAVFRGKDDSLYLLGVDRKFQPLHIQAKKHALSGDGKTLFYVDEAGTLGAIDLKTLEARTLATGATDLTYSRLNNGVLYETADSAIYGKDSEEDVLRALAKYLNENDKKYKDSGEELLYESVKRAYAQASSEGVVKDVQEYYRLLTAQGYQPDTATQYSYASLDGQTGYTIAVDSEYIFDICYSEVGAEDAYAYIAPDGGVMLCRGSGAPEKVASVGDPDAADIKCISAGGRMLVWTERAADDAYMVRYLDSKGVNAIDTELERYSSYIFDLSNADGSKLFLFCDNDEIITITDNEGYVKEKVADRLIPSSVLRPDNKSVYGDALESLEGVTFTALDSDYNAYLYMVDAEGKPRKQDFGVVSNIERDGDTVWYIDKNNSLFCASLQEGKSSERLVADHVRTVSYQRTGDGENIYYFGEQEEGEPLYSVPARGGVSREIDARTNSSSEVRSFAAGNGAVYMRDISETWDKSYEYVGELMLCRGDGAPVRIGENVVFVSDFRSYDDAWGYNYVKEDDFYFYGDAKIDAQNETIEYTLYHYDGKEATAVMEGLVYY